jgi:hypothetical protein
MRCASGVMPQPRDGIDGTTSQTIYAGHDYMQDEIRFGCRFARMPSRCRS